MPEELEFKPPLYIPHNLLPEGKDWEIGQTYRIKLVVKQTSKDETNASFEIIDASSLESRDRGIPSNVSSDSGTYRGK